MSEAGFERSSTFLDPWPGVTTMRAGAESLHGGPARAELRLSHDRRSLAQLAAAFLRRFAPSLGLFLVLALCGCAAPQGTRTDSRDFAVSTWSVSPQATQLAQKRARNYLKRHSYVAEDVRLLAVIADSVFPSEVPDLWVKLGRSETSSSAYLQRRGQTFKLWSVVLIDRTTLKPTRSGYLLANTPAEGEIVWMGGHKVLYVGRGN